MHQIVIPEFTADPDEYIRLECLDIMSNSDFAEQYRVSIYGDYNKEKYETDDSQSVDFGFACKIAGCYEEYQEAFTEAWSVPIPDDTPEFCDITGLDFECYTDGNYTFINIFDAKFDVGDVLPILAFDEDTCQEIYTPNRQVCISCRHPIMKLCGQEKIGDALGVSYTLSMAELMRVFPKYNKRILGYINAAYQTD